MKTVQDKREKEKSVVEEMIAMYCHGNHGTKNKGALCPECAELRDYAQLRSDQCPFMETKTFCVNCSIHCYQPKMQEKIRTVMRYAGPRMIFSHPVMAVSHVTSVMKEKAMLKKTERTD